MRRRRSSHPPRDSTGDASTGCSRPRPASQPPVSRSGRRGRRPRAPTGSRPACTCLPSPPEMRYSRCGGRPPRRANLHRGAQSKWRRGQKKKGSVGGGRKEKTRGPSTYTRLNAGHQRAPVPSAVTHRTIVRGLAVPDREAPPGWRQQARDGDRRGCPPPHPRRPRQPGREHKGPPQTPALLPSDRKCSIMGRLKEPARRRRGGTRNVSEVRERGVRHVVSISNTAELSR